MILGKDGVRPRTSEVFAMSLKALRAVRCASHVVVDDLASVAPEFGGDLNPGEVLRAVKSVIAVTLRAEVVGKIVNFGASVDGVMLGVASLT